MKKAQAAVSNIMMYILAVMLVGFILIFGYKAISGFIGNMDQVEYLKFKGDLKSAVKRVSFDYGSSMEEEFYISGFNEICFVSSYPDYGNLDTIANYGTAVGDYPLIENAIEDITDPHNNDMANELNVFLIDYITEEAFDIGPIIVDDDPNSGQENTGILCFPIKEGRLKILIQGRGNHAIISKAQ